jgi:hypothetical protein
MVSGLREHSNKQMNEIKGQLKTWMKNSTTLMINSAKR